MFYFTCIIKRKFSKWQVKIKFKLSTLRKLKKKAKKKISGLQKLKKKSPNLSRNGSLDCRFDLEDCYQPQ